MKYKIVHPKKVSGQNNVGSEQSIWYNILISNYKKYKKLALAKKVIFWSD